MEENQRYIYRNQAQEILDYIKSHPGTCIEGIISGTGWNRHLVEIATELMVEQKLIKDRGKDKWGDSTFEAIDKLTREDKIIGELRIKVDTLMNKIHEDLQLSIPSKLFDNISLPKMATGLMGFSAVAKSFPGLTSIITESIEHNKLLEEICFITGKTTDEIADFCQSHPYSLEDVKNMVMAGSKLDDLSKASISDNVAYIDTIGNPQVADLYFLKGNTMEPYTFIVTLPNNDRREVKAYYMDVTSNGVLYFEDEDEKTIMAFGAGNWVWAARKEEGDE